MESKSGFIAIVGKPNVGKSSLLNALLGEKVAIVSAKPQTTRTRITGVLTVAEKQYVFMDTPGLHKARTRLGDQMVRAVNTSLNDIDAVLLVVEPFEGLNPSEEQLIASIQKLQVPAILVINKIDLLKDPKTQIAARIAELMAKYPFDAVVPVSAGQKDGMDRLLSEIDRFLVESVHFFPDDSLTDQPERVLVAEMIREKILRHMQQEIPHGTAVVVEKMHERDDGSMIDIDATIYCERQTHKGMLIGKGGRTLKKIASEARADMESFLDAKVNLQCWVKVKEDWRNKDGWIANFGLSGDE
jgi:GTP-binding protein Era